MMIVAVVVSEIIGVFHMATSHMAGFGSCFQLQYCADNSPRLQFPPNAFFHKMGIGIRDNVHSGIMALTVHGPEVDVVDIQNTINSGNLLPDAVCVHTTRDLFKKNPESLPQIPEGMDRNEQRHTSRQNGVQNRKARKPHDDSASQNHRPSQYILQHVQADSSAVQGIPAPSEIRRSEIDA